VTLALGLIVSLFTALVVTRLLLTALAHLGIQNKALYGLAGERKPIKVFEKRWIWFIISMVVIMLGMIMLPVNNMTKGSPLNYDIEFVGGTSTLVTVNEGEGYDTYEALEADLLDMVVEATGDSTPQFQNVKGKDEFIIKTLTLDNTIRITLEAALIDKLNITTANIQSETISATISKEMKRDAILAIVIAAVFILVYITIRFKDFRFGISAVAALLHDILVVLTVYTVLGVAVNNSFIAAMLTIVGYSINDTIVLFDRVRENQRHMKRGDYVGVVDLSVSQTISRSINTSLTTFTMVLVLYIVGVASIEEFALPLMVGIISGTYSSIFIASPLWVMLKQKEDSLAYVTNLRQELHSRHSSFSFYLSK
jgi:SecD/SecF fusion protein